MRPSGSGAHIPALSSTQARKPPKMPSFEDLGLREELIRTLEEEEITEPTGLQASVIPALRRGGNLVARASSGSGKTLAYALGILDRLKPVGEEDAEDHGGGVRLLILSPTPSEAERVALAVTPYAQAVGLSVAALSSSWGTPAADAAIVAAATPDAMDAVRSSAIKLDSLEAIVLDGAAAIQILGQWDDVDALVELVPRDAQRVVITATTPEPVEDLIDRRVKRALRFPAEAAIEGLTPSTPPEGAASYVLVTESEKLELLCSQLRGREAGSPPPIVFCRNDERAADLAEKLTIRGFLVGDVEDEEAHVAIAAGGATREDLLDEIEGEPGQTISFDVPADAGALRARHLGDPDAVVLVQPRELAHLREIAAHANLSLRSVPPPADTSAAMAALRTFREEVRATIEREDLAAQMLVLEPLLEDFSAAEVAAALSAIARRRTPAPVPAAAPSAAGAQPTSRQAADKSSAPGPAPATWARLFVSIGSRDDIKPGDLVGALAGEANIQGSRIGKIEIRDSFSIVEVQADVADQVIRAVNGTTVKGRSVRVDYDRGGPAKRPPTKGGPARRTTRRPPRS